MDGRALTVAEVEQIADLESREVLLAKLAGAMKAKTSQAAGLFQAPLSQVARLAAALQEKRAAEAPAEAARGPAEAAEAEARRRDEAPAEAAPEAADAAKTDRGSRAAADSRDNRITDQHQSPRKPI